MSSVFTEYVRSLEPGGREPDPGHFAQLWHQLRAALASELKKRTLWTSSPSHLGIFGWTAWSESQTEGTGWDALDELATDGYTFVFLDRLRCLKAQAELKPNIDGLVFLLLRNFLHETQKRNDPLGYRIFEVLFATVERLIADRRLHVLKGPVRVRNETVLGFAAGEAPSAVPPGLEGIERWNDALLPDLVTARGEERSAVEARLEARILGLADQGVRAFRFKDLIDPLKADVRARWGELLGQARGEVAFADEADDQTLTRLVALVQPDTAFEEWERFDRIAACVAEGLEKLDVRTKTRAYLRTLWEFLRAFAAEVDAEAEVPSHRKLAELLGIPRDRLPGLFATLGEVVEGCREAASVGVETDDKQGRRRESPPEGGQSMEEPERRAELRRATAVALARLARTEAEIEERAPGPRPGDLYALPETAEPGLEWAVLWEAWGRVLMVPADTHPLVGSADVGIPRQASVGPLRLRCAFPVWTDAAVCRRGRRSGVVEASYVEEARRRQEEVGWGKAVGAAFAREADVAPEYREWAEEVLARAREELASAEVRARPRPRRQPRPARRRRPQYAYALAASFFLAALGLAFWVGDLRREVEELARPIVNPPRYELGFSESVRAEVVVELPAEATHFTLTLLLHRVPPHDGYVLEIRDGEDRVVWTSGVLEPSPRAEYTLTVPRRLLPAGRYRMRLYGELEDQRVRIDERKLAIAYQEDRP